MGNYISQIFNNRFNNGDIEFTELPEMKVNSDFLNNTDFDDHYNTDMELIILEELKKIAKEENIRITNKNYVKNVYLFNKVYEKRNIHFDIVDFFILFCESQGLDIGRLFEYLPPHYKREITEEIGQRFGKKIPKKKILF